MGQEFNLKMSIHNRCPMCGGTNGWTYVCDICGSKGCSSGCGYYFNKCDRCGKYICGKCSTNFGSHRVCSACMKKEPKFVQDWVDEDRI